MMVVRADFCHRLPGAALVPCGKVIDMRPQIVFLPGLLCDASVFAHQVASLSAWSDVKVADFSGEDSIKGMARNALSLFEGSISLIGFSMGGRAALEACRIAPDRVSRLCLVDTGTAPARENEAAMRQPSIDLAWSAGMKALAAEWLPPKLHIERATDAALIGPLTAMVERASAAQYERHIRALLARPDASPVLQAIHCPVLVMVGRQDCWSPLAQHEAMASITPRSRLVVIEDAGHFVPVEQPEACTAALLDWFQFHEQEDGL